VEEDAPTDKKDAEVSTKDEMSAAMIASIGFYKKVISPLLPPACRFLPTCSQYGVQAIEQFGPQKGAILTAWRLLRCSPFGGKGYDPPKWPPVAYTYGSY
jgi:putative membrane protein insertion efficiency factor